MNSRQRETIIATLEALASESSFAAVADCLAVACKRAEEQETDGAHNRGADLLRAAARDLKAMGV